VRMKWLPKVFDIKNWSTSILDINMNTLHWVMVIRWHQVMFWGSSSKSKPDSVNFTWRVMTQWAQIHWQGKIFRLFFNQVFLKFINSVLQKNSYIVCVEYQNIHENSRKMDSRENFWNSFPSKFLLQLLDRFWNVWFCLGTEKYCIILQTFNIKGHHEQLTKRS
jgi:hypothetical protein